MLFNSYPFLFVFLPLVLLGYFLSARLSHRFASAWLLAGSLAFYAYWNPKFVALLLASISFNFCLGTLLAMRKASMRPTRGLLSFAVCANIVLLGVFKYFRFFVGTYDALAGTNIALPDIVLPLGISFYSFTQIAFLVDSARGVIGPVNALHYALFVTYFPHLIAGPVLHHRQVMSQFDSPRNYQLQWPSIASGLAMFALGLSKKILVADTLAEYADLVFNGAAHGTIPNMGLAWAGTLAYSFQLYFDFSGYSDMAVGLSLLFNVRLPYNFDSPYKSANIIDFWRRWHMTLSQFLRDYLYFPLGGNRNGRTSRYINLMITMVLGGLWHGANWTFVVWGALHGAYLIINHLWKGFSSSDKFRSWKVASTFLLVTVAWVFFRAANLACAEQMLRSMFGMDEIALPALLVELIHSWFPDIRLSPSGFFGHTYPLFMVADGRSYLFIMLCCALLVWRCPNSQQLVLDAPIGRSQRFLQTYPAWSGAFIAALLCLDLANFDHVSTFLYYQF